MSIVAVPAHARRDLSPDVGSEITLDKRALLSGDHSADLRALLEERGVLVFPALNLTDAEQVDLTKTLGPMADDIFKISMDPLENPLFAYTKGAFFWHIDGTMSDVPIFASVMSCRRKSAVGGTTEFANTYAAFADLPPSEQEALGKLQVVHMFESSQRYVNPEPDYATVQDWQRFAPASIPLVWKHKSGRNSLVLGSTASHIEGMGVRESLDLLVRLRDHATQPRFVYSHDWTVGDLVIWDNTGTMHRVLAYPHDSGRLMHRTTIKGDEPFA